MLEGITDPAHPVRTLVFGTLFLALGLACLYLKFGPKWKQWGTDWSKPILGFGLISGLLGAANIALAIKWLVSGAA